MRTIIFFSRLFIDDQDKFFPVKSCPCELNVYKRSGQDEKNCQIVRLASKSLQTLPTTSFGRYCAPPGNVWPPLMILMNTTLLPDCPLLYSYCMAVQPSVLFVFGILVVTAFLFVLSTEMYRVMVSSAEVQAPLLPVRAFPILPPLKGTRGSLVPLIKRSDTGSEG